MKANKPRSKRVAPQGHVVAGDLRGEPRTLASDVQKAFVDSEHLVWADENHTVFVSRGEHPAIPEHWIVGTYMMGAPMGAIAQDLLTMWHERSRDFIID